MKRSAIVNSEPLSSANDCYGLSISLPWPHLRHPQHPHLQKDATVQLMRTMSGRKQPLLTQPTTPRPGSCIEHYRLQINVARA